MTYFANLCVQNWKVYVEVFHRAISLNLWNSHLHYKIPWYTSLFRFEKFYWNAVIVFFSNFFRHKGSYIDHLFVALCHAILNFKTPRASVYHNSLFSTGREQITTRSTPRTRTDNNSLVADFKRDINTEQETSQVDMLQCSLESSELKEARNAMLSIQGEDPKYAGRIFVCGSLLPWVFPLQ